MGKGRLCTKCGSYTRPFDAKQCANPSCHAVFSETASAQQRISSHCEEEGCNRPATIRTAGKWRCGEHFDRLKFGDASRSDGPGYAVWRQALERLRTSRREAGQQ